MGIVRVCDRCGNQLTVYDEQVDNLYQGKDICANCCIDIELAKSVAQSATIKNISQKEVLTRWIKLYENDAQ